MVGQGQQVRQAELLARATTRIFFQANQWVFTGLVFPFPIVFGLLLQGTGLWTTCWMFLALLAAVSLTWMHRVIRRMMHQQTPELMRRVEGPRS